MIFDSLNRIETYQGIHPGLYKGLELLRDTDFGAKADGTYQVDGNNLFYFLQSYETSPANETPEVHAKYIEIQCVLFGEERINFGILEDLDEEVLPRPVGDVRFYRGKTDSVTVTELEGEDGKVLELRVAEGDMGKVIGRQGRIAKEIRTIVKTVAQRTGEKVTVDIVD